MKILRRAGGAGAGAGEAMKILLHVPCDDIYALHNLDKTESWIIEPKKERQ